MSNRVLWYGIFLGGNFAFGYDSLTEGDWLWFLIHLGVIAYMVYQRIQSAKAGAS